MTLSSWLRSALLACAALAFALPATAQVRTLDQILAAKKLVVGVNPTLPPLASYDDKNEVVGYDVDIAQRLGKLLGVPVELVTVGSPDRVPFVATGKVDIVLGALTRNPERAKVIDDPELVSEVLDTIRVLAVDGMTMLLVSHEMAFVRDISTRVAFMDAGKIVEAGAPAQLFAAPLHSRTQEFIGKVRRAF